MNCLSSLLIQFLFRWWNNSFFYFVLWRSNSSLFFPLLLYNLEQSLFSCPINIFAVPCRFFTYYDLFFFFFLVVKHWISFWFSFPFAWKKILDGFTYSTYRSLNPLAMKFSKLTDLVELLTFFQKEHLWIKPVNNKSIHFNVWTYMTCFCAY